MGCTALQPRYTCSLSKWEVFRPPPPEANDPTLQLDGPEGNTRPEDVITVSSHSATHASPITAEDRVYEYQPLSTPSTVRLVEVMQEKVDGCIACKIHTFDLQQQSDIEYEALSYVWGIQSSPGGFFWQTTVMNNGNRTLSTKIFGGSLTTHGTMNSLAGSSGRTTFV